MLKKMKMGVTKATSIAAINFVVQSLKLGAFISEFEMNDYEADYSESLGNGRVCTISGRTNNGTWVYANCTVFLKDGDEYTESIFPFKKIFVSIASREIPEIDEYLHFECQITKNNFRVTKLEKSPF